MLYFQFFTSTFLLCLATVIAFGVGSFDVTTIFFIAALAVASYCAWKAVSISKARSANSTRRSVWQNYLVSFAIGICFFGISITAAPLQPATGDEISHALNAIGHPYYDFDTKNIVMTSALHHQPPLHYVASSASLRLWGLDETGARIPSVVFASLTLVAFFIMCREMGVSFTVSLLTTLLLAISNIFFRYSIEGRPYSAALFAFTIFLSASLNLLRNRHNEVPKQEIYGAIGAGIVFIMSIGMQPPFMMVVLTLAGPLYSSFRWRNTVWYFAANAVTAAITAPVLALIASRTADFTPNRGREIFTARLLELPNKLLTDNRMFWNDVFFHGAGEKWAACISIFALIAGITFYFRRNKFADSAFLGTSSVLAGLTLTAVLFFLAISSVFTLFVEHPFGVRHAITNVILFFLLFALSTEMISQALSFKRQIQIFATAVFASALVFASIGNYRMLLNRLKLGPTNFDARAVHTYLKDLPTTMPANWRATGYALDLIEFRSVDYSGFFGLPFYSSTNFPTSISVNQKPRRNLPVSRYLIEDFRLGHRPDEFIFLSIFPYFGRLNAFSISEVPWKPTDGVSVIKFPGFILTRVKVANQPLETAIRFFEKIKSAYLEKPTDALDMSLLLDTLTRLYLEIRNCDKALENYKQIKPDSNVILQNEFPELLDTCRNID
jgi:hypothetical protein